MSGAQVRRDDPRVPSFDFDQNKILEILEEDPERELNAQLIKEIVNPMLDIVRQLVRENPDEAKKGIRVTINVKSESAPDAEYLSTAEVAEMYRMSQQQIRRWCEDGKIAAVRSPGGTWRISASQFEGVAVVPKGKRGRRPVDSVAGAWKGYDDALRELREGRD